MDDAPLTIRILPSKNRCTRKGINFFHDFNYGYRCLTDYKNVPFGNKLIPMPIVEFVYDAPMTQRMLPSENHCILKWAVSFMITMMGYRCITDLRMLPSDVAFGNVLL